MDYSAIVNNIISGLIQIGEPLNGDTRLKEDLGMDSLNLTRLIVELEESLNIEIDLSLLVTDELETVNDVCTLAENSMR